MYAHYFAYGHDGRLYAVFPNEIEAENNAKRFPDCPVASFDGFCNAYDVTRLAWPI